MLTFETAIERVLGHEGRYVNNPADPGGETNWGISKRSYPDLDIKNLTRDAAKKLYFRDFWLPVAAGVGDEALTFQVLDAAVNHGMGNAVRFLQRSIGVADDGHWGPYSKQVFSTKDIKDVHLLFFAERFEFWAKLRAFDEFGRGWVNRGALNLRLLAQDN